MTDLSWDVFYRCARGPWQALTSLALPAGTYDLGDRARPRQRLTARATYTSAFESARVAATQRCRADATGWALLLSELNLRAGRWQVTWRGDEFDEMAGQSQVRTLELAVQPAGGAIAASPPDEMATEGDRAGALAGAEHPVEGDSLAREMAGAIATCTDDPDAAADPSTPPANESAIAAVTDSDPPEEESDPFYEEATARPDAMRVAASEDTLLASNYPVPPEPVGSSTIADFGPPLQPDAATLRATLLDALDSELTDAIAPLVDSTGAVNFQPELYAAESPQWQIELAQEAFAGERGGALLLSGTVKATDEASGPGAELRLHVRLWNPQTAETVFDVPLELDARALPAPFEQAVPLPAGEETYLLLGEVLLRRADAPDAYLARSAFSVSLDCDELLATLYESPAIAARPQLASALMAEAIAPAASAASILPPRLAAAPKHLEGAPQLPRLTPQREPRALSGTAAASDRVALAERPPSASYSEPYWEELPELELVWEPPAPPGEDSPDPAPERTEVQPPQVRVPEGALTAGKALTVRLTVPVAGQYVKLWVRDRLSRDVLDGPRALLEFAEREWGWVAQTKLTLPLGTHAVRFEAVAVGEGGRESYKATVDRAVVPPPLDEVI